MTLRDREVVFVCRECGASSRSPRTPVNECPDCDGRVVLRYADRVDGVTDAARWPAERGDR